MAEIELCPVQLPGRGRRLHEAPFTRLLPLVAAIGQALPPYLDKPFAFFGHSMGGAIGFELARYLLQMFPGDHFFLQTTRPLLLQAIARKLYQHQTPPSPA